jgi:hypothetical protein
MQGAGRRVVQRCSSLLGSRRSVWIAGESSASLISIADPMAPFPALAIRPEITVPDSRCTLRQRESWANYDMFGLLQQLGVVPAMTPAAASTSR